MNVYIHLGSLEEGWTLLRELDGVPITIQILDIRDSFLVRLHGATKVIQDTCSTWPNYGVARFVK